MYLHTKTLETACLFRFREMDRRRTDEPEDRKRNEQRVGKGAALSRVGSAIRLHVLLSYTRARGVLTVCPACLFSSRCNPSETNAG